MRPDNNRGFTGRGGIVAATIAATVAAGTLVGCSGTSYSSNAFRVTGNANDLAKQSQLNFNTNETQGLYTADWYQGEAKDFNLPARWLAEAENGVITNEMRRAAAQAGLAKAGADRFEALALQDAELTRVAAQRVRAQNEAQTLETTYNASLDELSAQAEAALIAAEVQAQHGKSSVNSRTKQWQSQHDRMTAQAERNWNSAQAEYDKMLAERQRVELEGEAQISHMRDVAQHTAKRAAERVAQLRAEARASQIQTAARDDSLDSSIKTTGDRFNAESKRWSKFARSARDEADAQVAELRSEADRVRRQVVEEQFRLNTLNAQLEYERLLAQAEQAEMEAEAEAQDTRAEVTNLRAEAEKTLSLAQAAYEDELGAIDRMIERGTAVIHRRFAEADRIERQARAEFLKAEAASRAEAIRETSRHQTELSEAELALIDAEARAEALRIQEELFSKLATQRGKNAAFLPGKNEPTPKPATMKDQAPDFASATNKPENLEPQRVAQFKSALAEAASIRKQQQAAHNALEATTDERIARADAWWDQRIAQHESTLAAADATERTGGAEVNGMFAHASELIAQAEAQRERQFVAAESGRNEAMAEIVRLNAQADALDAIADAEVREYDARAHATRNIGDSEVDHLRVTANSNSVRGRALASRFLAEARSVEDTQFAVVTQMRQEIATAERVLDAELAKLDRAADSFIAIAEATYDEKTSEAVKFARVNEALTEEFAANNQADQQIGLARVAFLENVKEATAIAAQAEVDQMVADADFQFQNFEAQDTAYRAAIDSRMAMAEAEANQQFSIAMADDAAVRATFDSRIATVTGQRDRAYADQYLTYQREQAAWAQAAAAAATYADLSAEARANLKERADEFQRLLNQEWDERLANLPQYPDLQDTEGMRNNAFNNLGVQQFVNEPIDIDN